MSYESKFRTGHARRGRGCWSDVGDVYVKRDFYDWELETDSVRNNEGNYHRSSGLRREDPRSSADIQGV